MADRYPIMVLGGYGVFGERICRRLAQCPNVRLIIVGRSSYKAKALAASIRAETPDADVTTLAFNVSENLDPALATSGARLVIHTCGPFQGQGYDVPKICIGRGVHYIDLADDRTFVANFDSLDDQARKAGVLAISGASSVPGLSSTVIESLRPAFTRMRRIAMGIAPGNRAPRGAAVVGAILSYTGKPIPQWNSRQWREVYGWQGLKRRNIKGPRVGELGPRWFAACDIPDLALLPERYPDLETVTFHAGLELPMLHFGLWAFSWPVRAGLVKNLAPAAPLFHRAAQAFEPLGTDRGGMFVEVKGDGPDGAPLTRTWNLIAGAGHGPSIPCMPAVILARRLARGELVECGAKPCLNMITLEEFREALGDLDIAFETA